jgi:cyclopropane fatty-acyl-phospholipid synthase-like methyltransferase
MYAELYCDELRLSEGQAVLELGCGWGSFCLFAVCCLHLSLSCIFLVRHNLCSVIVLTFEGHSASRNVSSIFCAKFYALQMILQSYSPYELANISYCSSSSTT